MCTVIRLFLLQSVVSAQVEPDTVVLERDRMGQLVLKKSVCASKGHRVIISGEMMNQGWPIKTLDYCMMFSWLNKQVTNSLNFFDSGMFMKQILFWSLRYIDIQHMMGAGSSCTVSWSLAIIWTNFFYFILISVATVGNKTSTLWKLS